MHSCSHLLFSFSTTAAIILAACIANTVDAQSVELTSQGVTKHDSDKSNCRPLNFSVRIDDLDAAHYKIAGSLCGADKSDTLLITLHGATYNHLYWDWPQDPKTYSFIQNMPANVSILNIDRLGVGTSDHPFSDKVTGPAQARAVHEIVGSMRAEGGYTTIVLVGHSLGSGIAELEAATYYDVDGIILTGFMHGLAAGGGQVPAALYPAAFDPLFVSLGLDFGYLTTKPGTRSMTAFYNPAIADPAVIAFDDEHKDVVALPDIMSFVGLIFDPTVSQRVDGPVLSLQGQYDAGFCDLPDCPQAALEPAAWSPAAQLELHVIPNAGHDIHLHAATAKTEFKYVSKWLHKHFGTDE